MNFFLLYFSSCHADKKKLKFKFLFCETANNASTPTQRLIESEIISEKVDDNVIGTLDLSVS